MKINKILWLSTVCLVIMSCASKKKKASDVSALSRFYHNTTAYYNGYFNADEILDLTYERLQESHMDDYTDVVSMYSYDHALDVKSVTPDLDRAIEKVVKVANLHEPSRYVDDCYVLMAEAQYLKKDFESAEETLRFFETEFNPANPEGRQYRAKDTKKSKRKAKERERKLKLKEREATRKKREKEKEEAKKLKKQEKKAKEKAKKERQRAKKAERKAREKARKKNRKKKRRSGKKRRKRTKEKVENTAKKIEETAEQVQEKVKSEISKIKLQENDGEVEGRLGRDTSRPEENKDEPEQPQTQLSQRDKTSYSKGLVWLARTYVARDNYSSAESTLTRLDNNGVTNKDVLREIPVIMGDIRIKQQRYKEAIPYVEKAYQMANDKYLRARYAFVLGQLMSKVKSFDEASTYFAVAEKKARKFDMRFAANLNNLKNQMLSGASSKESVSKQLERMLKEDKYVDQRDQIHMTMAEIHLGLGNTDEAVASYQAAIASSTQNENLKIIAYKELGELFYEKERYVEAKNYMDSVVIVAGIEDPRGEKAQRISSQLEEIAKNILIITEKDSLLAMAKLTDAELREIARKIVEEKTALIKGEEEDKSGFSSTKSTFAKSNFPFYNPQVAERGRKDFIEKWGDRALEDNWRVSSLARGESRDEDYTEEDEGDSQVDAQVEAEMRKIKGRIPYGGSKKTDATRAVETALYILGGKYRTNIHNYKKSIEVHEELIRRFPDTRYKLDAYYYIYLNYKDIGDMVSANTYQQRITTEFGDSEYAKMINDPTYLESQRAQNVHIEDFYAETYKAYTEGRYQDVSDNTSRAANLYGEDHSLYIKFDLLNTLSIGSLRGKEVYINGLKNFVKKYDGTPEQVRASEILRFLEGDGEAFSADVKGANAEYKYEDGLQYLIHVCYKPSDRELTKMKINISNYNKKYHRHKKLQIDEQILNVKDNTFLVIVKNYNSIDDGMDYYDEIVKDMEGYMGKTTFLTKTYVINQANYRKLLSDKVVDIYDAFFKTTHVR